MGPYRSENFKTLLLLQITAKSFQASPEFSSHYPGSPHKTAFGIFEIFKFPIFNDFFFENFKFTIVAYGEIKNLNYLKNECS